MERFEHIFCNEIVYGSMFLVNLRYVNLHLLDYLNCNRHLIILKQYGKYESINFMKNHKGLCIFIHRILDSYFLFRLRITSPLSKRFWSNAKVWTLRDVIRCLFWVWNIVRLIKFFAYFLRNYYETSELLNFIYGIKKSFFYLFI